MRRNLRFILPWAPFERNKVEAEAREANLNTTDFVRLKLGLEQLRKTRNTKNDDPLENPEGNPDNAVDVEELARGIYAEGEKQLNGFPTMAEARREAKRRLEETPQT